MSKKKKNRFINKNKYYLKFKYLHLFLVLPVDVSVLSKFSLKKSIKNMHFEYFRYI